MSNPEKIWQMCEMFVSNFLRIWHIQKLLKLVNFWHFEIFDHFKMVAVFWNVYILYCVAFNVVKMNSQSVGAAACMLVAAVFACLDLHGRNWMQSQWIQYELQRTCSGWNLMCALFAEDSYHHWLDHMPFHTLSHSWKAWGSTSVIDVFEG